MQFFLGAICGVLLTVLATFIAGERVAASLESIREKVHELTR
jgi:hypothetical protein